jgi:hypothetical protein
LGEEDAELDLAGAGPAVPLSVKLS